jgi:hypothetical protein
MADYEYNNDSGGDDNDDDIALHKIQEEIYVLFSITKVKSGVKAWVV